MQKTPNGFITTDVKFSHAAGVVAAGEIDVSLTCDPTQGSILNKSFFFRPTPDGSARICGDRGS